MHCQIPAASQCSRHCPKALLVRDHLQGSPFCCGRSNEFARIRLLSWAASSQQCLDSLRLKPSATSVFLCMRNWKSNGLVAFRRGRSIYRHWRACLFAWIGVLFSWGIPIAPHLGVLPQCWRAIDYWNKCNLRVKCYLLHVTMPNYSLLKVTMK